MIGQMTIYDLIREQPKRITEKCVSCKYHVWLTKDGKRVRSCDRYDGCEYTEKQSCYSCENYKEVVDAATCKPLGYKTCSNYDAWNRNLNNVPEVGCEYWEKDDV